MIRNTTFLLYESTSLARSQGLTLARCCIQTRGLSRGIKIVMGLAHNIVDASFKYDVFVHVCICCRTILSMHYNGQKLYIS